MKPEPIAYLTPTSTNKNPPHGWSVRFFHFGEQDDAVPVYTASALASVRRAALEEAEQAILKLGPAGALYAIRALIEEGHDGTA